MEAEILPKEAFEISPKTRKEIQRLHKRQERLRKKYAKVPIGGKFPISIREGIFKFLYWMFRIRAR